MAQLSQGPLGTPIHRDVATAFLPPLPRRRPPLAGRDVSVVQHPGPENQVPDGAVRPRTHLPPLHAAPTYPAASHLPGAVAAFLPPLPRRRLPLAGRAVSVVQHPGPESPVPDGAVRPRTHLPPLHAAPTYPATGPLPGAIAAALPPPPEQVHKKERTT